MAKPSNYDNLTDAEKWELCLGLLQSQRGKDLLDRAFELAGSEIQKERKAPFEDMGSEASVLFKMAVACQALEVAIGSLTIQANPDWPDVQDMEIIYDGLRIQIRLAKPESQ